MVDLHEQKLFGKIFMWNCWKYGDTKIWKSIKYQAHDHEEISVEFGDVPRDNLHEDVKYSLIVLLLWAFIVVPHPAILSLHCIFRLLL